MLNHKKGIKAALELSRAVSFFGLGFGFAAILFLSLSYRVPEVMAPEVTAREQILKPAEIEEPPQSVARIKEEPIFEPPQPPAALPRQVLVDVPFTSQTPFGEWHDPRQDYGCEEASLLMTWHWLRNEELTPEYARKVITTMSDWELENFGEFHDRSAADTMALFSDYFGYDRTELFYNINVDDIRKTLASGQLAIVPVDGRLLPNPYYTPPGPAQHMLVVVGYDDASQELITNDPGTKHGRQIRYDYVSFNKALRDYKTGHNEPLESILTAMITVAPAPQAYLVQ